MSIINREVIKVMSLMKKKVWIYLSALILDAITDSFCYNIAIAFIMKDMLNAIVTNDKRLFVRAMTLGVISLLVGFLFVPIFKYLWNKVSSQVIVEIKESIFKHLSTLPISYYEKHHSGEIITLVTSNITQIETLYNQSLMMLIFAIIHGTLAIGSMLVLDWRIAIIILPLGFISIYINKKFAKSIRDLSEKIQLTFSLENQKLTNILASIKVSKMFNLEEKLIDEYTQTNNELSLFIMKRAKITGLMDSLNYFYDKFRYVIITLIGLLFVMKGFTSVGILVAMVSLQIHASYMFTNIGKFITDSQESLAGASKIFDLLDAKEEDIVINESYSPINNEEVALEMKEINFEYEKGNKVLSNLNLSLKSGQRIALVGPSGSGKSTISKLFLRLYSITSGDIYIYGTHINDVNLSELRKMISYVSQDAYLFSGTIEENIKCGNLGCTTDEVISAAKIAKAYDFIMEQPYQFQTLVCENAVNLSGGQKQRISIARALLKNSPIIILDEATSSLDSKTENEIQEAVNTLTQNKTVLIITHRLASIDNVDTIYVLDKGEIVENGTHNQLMSNNGIYKKMYELQFAKVAI